MFGANFYEQAVEVSSSNSTEIKNKNLRAKTKKIVTNCVVEKCE